MAGNGFMYNPKFHVNATTIGNGLEYSINGQGSEMNLFFKTEVGTTFKTIVEVYNYDTNEWYPWNVYQIPSYDDFTLGITSTGNIYNTSLMAIDKIRVRIAELSGTLSVYGKVVN